MAALPGTFLWLLFGLAAALLALVIARRLRRTPDLLRAPADEAPSEWSAWLPPEQFLEFEGMRVRLAQAGRGPNLVLLHGIGASMHAWRFVFKPLSERFRVTAIDLPGFGLSGAPADGDFGLDAQAERAQKILSALGIYRSSLVGSSMGGAIALWMSKQDPARFGAVATLAPAVDYKLSPPGLRSLRATSFAFGRVLGPRTMRLILQRVVARPELIDDESVEAYLRPFRESRSPLAAFFAALALLSDRRLPGELADPRARVLVLYGARDRIVPRASIARYLKVAPRAELMEHPFGGHHIMEDEPRWVAGALLGFFGRA